MDSNSTMADLGAHAAVVTRMTSKDREGGQQTDSNGYVKSVPLIKSTFTLTMKHMKPSSTPF